MLISAHCVVVIMMMMATTIIGQDNLMATAASSDPLKVVVGFIIILSILLICLSSSPLTQPQPLSLTHAHTRSSRLTRSLSTTARTIFSIVIAEIVGKNVMFLVSKEWLNAVQGVVTFFFLSFPAAYINR